jgi:putative transposase
VVWIPKCRKKTLYGELRKYLGETFRDLAVQKDCNVIEGHLLPGHVHMLISIPPKYAVSQVVGYIKANILPGRTWGGKGTLRARIFGLVVTSSPQSERMRKPSENISGDRRKNRRLDQLSMFGEEPPSGGQ